MSLFLDLPAIPLPDFRPRLDRICGPGTRTLCMIGQNPSTAGPLPTDKNDPTICIEIKLAARLGFDRLVKGNLSPKIETDAEAFFDWFEELADGERKAHCDWAYSLILRMAAEADMTIACWGRWFKGDGWPFQVRARLQAEGIKLHVLGLNLDGSPRHPMARGHHRIPDDVVPVEWRT